MSKYKWVECQATFCLEIAVRAILSLIFVGLEQVTPFTRKIQPEEIWLYKNPPTEDYFPNLILWPVVFFTPTMVLFIYFLIKRNRIELCQGLLSLSLALMLNGVITNTIKLIVGRPRPDFFYRCFPDGKFDLGRGSNILDFCKGDEATIIQGQKSFPSGHSSFSFCSLGFTTLWLYGKLMVFRGYRSEGWKLVVGGLPLMFALIIALSRTCDYHHHWQDVLVGSLMGLSIAYLCYRQYFPRLSSAYCHLPYRLIPPIRCLPLNIDDNQENGSSSGHYIEMPREDYFDPESHLEEQIKFI